MTGNTTAVACINKQASTKSPSCNEITKQIWDYAIFRDLWLTVAHCPGVENMEADVASREFKDQTEWTLKQECFDYICKTFGEPSIDLFASRLNYKVKRYCAWEPDPRAVYIDSFMYNWETAKLVYAFQHFGIVYVIW